MKAAIRAAALAWAALAGRAAADAGGESPIGKVLTMLSDLQAKIIQEGEVVQKEYAEFSEWCEDRARNLEHEIKTGKADVDRLKAAIDEQASTVTSLTTKVEETAAGIATDEADLKAATEIREKEHADFATEEKELMEIIDMLARATAVLERAMKKGDEAFLQGASAGNVVQVLSTMVEASLIGSADAAKLTAFVQDSQQEEGGDVGAPAAEVYKSHTSNIVETLQDLSDKAEDQLEDARKKEVAAGHNYDMLKQSLEDEIKFANKELEEAKHGIAAATEKKAVAEGELVETEKELAADEGTQKTLHHDCMTRAQDFEAETNSRGEELTALATAKKIIQEATTSALSQVSLLQVARSQLTSGADLAGFAAARLVRDLARKERSASLAQLARRMAATLRGGARSADAFEKVKAMIKDMISRLEAEATAEATKKAYCDKELKETAEKNEDKSGEIDSLSTKIEAASAKSGQLKEEIARLQEELANLAKSQAEMDKLRAEQKETYAASKAELEKGLEGLKMAIKVLKEYYAGAGEATHNTAADSASGIVALLETCESDFAKNLAEITSEEESAASEYEEVSKANEIEKTAKDQDVVYKVKESKELDKTAAELTSDRTGVQAELDAILEYLAKLQDECIAKPEAYETRVARREAEIAGLKEALQTLENETVFLQRRAARRTLRGSAGRHIALKA